MLFTFPSRYSSAIGLSVVFSLSGWSPIIQPEFLVFRHTQVAVNSASASRTGLSPSAAGRSGPFRSLPLRMTPLLLPRHMPCDTAGLGSSPFDRLYLGNRCYFLFLRVLRCFSSRRSPPLCEDEGIAPSGLPHSDICGSQCICHSPQLFAACHVLLRLREPQASPMRPFAFRFFFNETFSRSLPEPRKSRIGL